MARLVSSQVRGQTPLLSINTVPNYKSRGWEAIVLHNDLITPAVVPAIGGRVIQ
jgi:hypothetical protein